MTPPGPIVAIRDARRDYAGRDGVVFQLRVEDFSLRAGEALGVIGPSGCGKSTFLEMLALISRPDAAAEFVLDDGATSLDIAALWRRSAFDALALARGRNLGFVHQAGNLYPFLNTRDNILLPARLLGLNREEREARLRQLTEFLGIGHLLNSMPETLSYGERQRAAIARALIHRPRLVLADEPTSALDPQTARRVMSLLQSAAERDGAALVCVSHDHQLLADSGIPALAIKPDTGGENRAIRWILPGNSIQDMNFVDFVDSATPPDGSARNDTERGQGACHSARSRRIHVSEHKSAAGRKYAALTAIFLAWRDFLHERNLSLCAVLAFTAALAPCLLLAGLRYGIVETMGKRLLDNPNVLAVNPYGNIRYTQKSLAELSAHPSVDFLIPRTRMLAANVVLAAPGGAVHDGDLVPSAAGDPVLRRYGLKLPDDGIILTQNLARLLPGVNTGDTVEIRVARRHDGKFEQVTRQAKVAGILPDAADWKNDIYAPLAFVEAVERYRDGFAVPELDWPGETPPPVDAEEGRGYAGFRMYVKTLDDVVAMRDFLMARGIETYTFAREVETLRGIRHALSLGALLIGGTALFGLGLSLASLSAAGVRRKLRIFAQTRLMGLYARESLLFPLVQSCLVSLGAATLSLILYAAAAWGFDHACAAWLAPGESVCRLPLAALAPLYLGSLVFACLCASGAGGSLLNLEPAAVLRREG
jgi:putative ABC transport system permease protein